jgi:hypothetical protein
MEPGEEVFWEPAAQISCQTRPSITAGAAVGVSETRVDTGFEGGLKIGRIPSSPRMEIAPTVKIKAKKPSPAIEIEIQVSLDVVIALLRMVLLDEGTGTCCEVLRVWLLHPLNHAHEEGIIERLRSVYSSWKLPTYFSFHSTCLRDVHW